MGQQAFNWSAAVAIAVLLFRGVFEYGILTEKVDTLQRSVTGLESQIKQLQQAR